MNAYKDYVERRLSPARFRHSLGAMRVMGELAEVYGLDRESAETAGLLHDAAKDLEPSQQAAIAREAGVEIYCEPDRDFHLYLHGPIGAHIVNNELGIDDPDILDAIAFHTYYGRGENLRAPMTWCLRFSDILEPTRDWRSVKWLCSNAGRLADVVYSGRMTEGAYLQTGWLIRWFEEDGMPVHPNMVLLLDELSHELGGDDAVRL